MTIGLRPLNSIIISLDEVGSLLPGEIGLLMYQYHAYFVCLTTSDHVSLTNDHIFGTDYHRSSIIDHQYSLLSLLYLVAKLHPQPIETATSECKSENFVQVCLNGIE